jgi:hypothetical protein
MAEIVAEYIRHIPPEHFSINFAGSQLPIFLREHKIGIDFGVPQAMIAELAAFDAAHMDLALQSDASVQALNLDSLIRWTPDQWDEATFALRGEHRLLHPNWNVLSVYTSLQSDEVPPPPDLASAPILMTRTEDGLSFEPCPENIQRLLCLPEAIFTLIDLVEIFKAKTHSEEEATGQAVEAMILAVKRSMIGVSPI